MFVKKHFATDATLKGVPDITKEYDQTKEEYKTLGFDQQELHTARSNRNTVASTSIIF